MNSTLNETISLLNSLNETESNKTTTSLISEEKDKNLTLPIQLTSTFEPSVLSINITETALLSVTTLSNATELFYTTIPPNKVVLAKNCNCTCVVTVEMEFLGNCIYDNDDSDDVSQEYHIEVQASNIDCTENKKTKVKSPSKRSVVPTGSESECGCVIPIKDSPCPSGFQFNNGKCRGKHKFSLVDNLLIKKI